MNCSRRFFIGGVGAALGDWALPASAFAAPDAPSLRFGVISDVHIGGRKEAPERLRFTLKWMEAHGVEAVLCAGDIAHTGLIRQMEEFAAIWHSVFPDGKASDGRKVELMISTGNHDIAANWVKLSDAEARARKFCYRDNPQRIWDRLFGETWDLVWRKEVKGFTFIGAQWQTLDPPIERYMKEHAKEIDPARPFFFCQHGHPQGTCHRGLADCFDDGRAVRALSPFPNAVAFTGHSHCTLADERAVWQGAFTSIGAGCLHEGGYNFDYANAGAFWHPSGKKHLMRPLNDPDAWGGDPQGGCFEVVDVYADRLVVRRRSSVCDLPIGPDWIVPVPSRKGAPFDFAVRAATRSAPQFAKDAAVKVAVCPKGHPLENAAHAGEPCVHVSFPNARPVDGCRAFEYVVTAAVDGKPLRKLRFMAAGGARPEARSDLPTDCLFAAKDLPADREIVFSVVPRECFGKEGRPLVSAPIRLGT